VAARAAAEAVKQRMAAIGCRQLAAAAEELLARVAPADRPVRVATLGTFRLVRAGTVLPTSVWRSRKARDVLKILLARRGRPVTREFLMEALWPGEPPDPLANRLHVAISTLRSVLDPDRELSSDAYVVTDDDAVRIRFDHLAVDVEQFLADATAGRELLRSGRAGEALSRLARAEGRYGGDFLEEDLYQDWAAPLREQARAAYLEVAAQLARHAEATGDADAAIRFLLRILEHDPYDERAHLRLVSTFAAVGRHGDARRYYRSYCTRMDEIEVEAAPFPAA
jgi:DNA-binding SARP family transcriptional activator